jgi:hypothetical protein
MRRGGRGMGGVGKNNVGRREWRGRVGEGKVKK